MGLTTSFLTHELGRWRWAVPGCMAQFQRAKHTSPVRGAKIFLAAGKIS